MPAEGTQRIAYLDGWRAVAVSLVILDHLMILYGAESTPFGKFGVYLFFAISGYIITRLLVLERASSGGIDLQAFWIRRVARIVPPFMLYTVIVLVLVAFGAAGPEVTGQAAQAITFTCNINVGPGCGWLFGHTWSLAFEEQFYLVSRYFLPDSGAG